MRRRAVGYGSVLALGTMVSLFCGQFALGGLTADAIYQATGVRGGLVVHVGCGDGQLTAALHVNDRYVVQGLDTDGAKVDAARRLFHVRGLSGPVTANRFDGRHLPYVSGIVNLLIADEPSSVTQDEIYRVLAPAGVAYVRSGETWQKTVKPRPPGIDEWSHFLHDASGNAVANDLQVGPPRRLRWLAGPRWCRSHEIPSSVNAVVTAGGRVFTIFDEGPTGVYRDLPQRCKLIARDAASGVLLWKVPLHEWGPEFGTGTGNRWNIHHTIPRRLVATADRVYVTLSFLHAPVSVLDAATGKVLTEGLDGTRGADEMILSDGVLIVKTSQERSVGATVRIRKESLDDTLVAIDTQSGRQLWRKEHTRVVPYALSALAGRVVYHNLEELVCLDARSGAEKWRAPNNIVSTLGGESTLVINDGVVLFHGRRRLEAPAGKKSRRPKQELRLTAYALDDGHELWTHQGSRSLAGACTQPTDVFVANGIVWCGTSLDGRDLHTGEVSMTLSLDELISPGHHYRCHRAKATQRYLIWPKRGAEFIDLEGDQHMRNDWLRAPCFTGATPANGMLYVPPSQCFCYPGVKVSGFLALSADPSEQWKPASAEHLQRGPAFGKVTERDSADDDDWPMYRHDPARSGATRMAVPADIAPRWNARLSCRGTPPVIVGDRVWIAEKDAHRIRCLDATNGKDVWDFTAGGRIDSAPTVANGLVLFGCRDGAVYCLRATDGTLVWRFLAAPSERFVVSYDQLESLWPVQGSVLLQDGVVYFAAGRSSFLDGGIAVYGLDANTGKPLYTHRLEGPWPDIHKDVGTPFAMEGALPDLLVSDGQYLYMQRIKFDAQLNRLDTKQESSLGELDMGADHLVATGGFLDDTGFDRLYWMYSRRWPGFYFSQHAPKSGQLVVFDDKTTYAVKYFYRRIQWSPAFFPGDQGYLLYADANDNEPILEDKTVKGIDWLPKESLTDKYRRGGRGVEKGTGYRRQRPAIWQEMVPLRIRAMVLSGKYLFAVGLPDRVDPQDPTAALEGRQGAILQVFSTSDGKLVKSYPLESPPAFDGLSAAQGRLYLATADGRVVCFGPQALP